MCLQVDGTPCDSSCGHGFSSQLSQVNVETSACSQQQQLQELLEENTQLLKKVMKQTKKVTKEFGYLMEELKTSK